MGGSPYLSLSDVAAAPHDPDELVEHLRKLGVVPTLPAQPAAPLIPEMTPPKALSGPATTVPYASTEPEHPMPRLSHVESPSMPSEMPAMTPPSTAQPGMENNMVKPMAAPTLSEGEKAALPLTSPAVSAGSVPYYEGKLGRAIAADTHDTLSDHPSFLGKVGHTLGRVGNVLGDIFVPGAMETIPGTDLYKQATVRNAEKELAGAKKEEGEEQLRGAQTEEAKARTAKLEQEGEPDIVQDAAGNAVGWKDDKGYHSFDDPETPSGLKAISQKWQGKTLAKPTKESVEQALVAAAQDAFDNNRDPDKDPAVQFWEKEKEKLANAKEGKPSEEDKAISDYLQGHNIPDTPTNRDRARSVLKTRDRSSADEETKELRKELLRGQVEKSKEPTADEQRRADLGNNMLENLSELEALVDRRPDLFGPVAGRVSGAKAWIGTGDKDIARIQAIKEYLGMASVGAHAMRNAHHVEVAADAVMNSLKNEPGATKAAIGQARKSVQTFIDDATRRRRAIDESAGRGGGGGEGGGHSFTYNGTKYENVPDKIYQKYKGKPGFQE